MIREFGSLYKNMTGANDQHSLHFLSQTEYDQYHRPYEKQYVVEGVTTAYDLKDVTYTINSAGFRAPEFEQLDTVDVVVSGCSHTFGFGIPQQDTWGHYITQRLNLKTFINLGMNGAGMEQVLHCVVSYLASDLPQPRLVFVQWPSYTRLPHQYDDGIRNAINLSHEWMHELMEPWQRNGWEKFVADNTAFELARTTIYDSIIQQLCSQRNIKYTSTDDGVFNKTVHGRDYLGRARDLIHCDGVTHKQFAERMLVEMIK